MERSAETAHVVTRDVAVEECPWLNESPGGPVLSGTTVYRFCKPTYGAVRDFAATLDPDGDYPFFELPWDAVEPIPSPASTTDGERQ